MGPRWLDNPELAGRAQDGQSRIIPTPEFVIGAFQMGTHSDMERFEEIESQYKF